MERIKYFLAAVYQSIKSRRPSGTPYFNLSLGITGVILLNIIDALLLVKLWFQIDLITHTRSTFIACFILLGGIIMFLVRYFIPEDEISDVDVAFDDIKSTNAIFFLYAFLSIALMVVLLVLNSKVSK